MAKKVNAMQLALATQARGEITDRWPEPVSPALYLMQLRLPRLRISPSTRKLTVIMDPESSDAVPQCVKIIHLA
jgi:hypothetical protein